MTRTITSQAWTTIINRAAGLALAVALTVFPAAAEAATGWYQVNEDGFAASLTTTVSALTTLVAFDDVLYASNEDGVFQMRKKTVGASGGTCIYWAALSVPGAKASPLAAIGGVLYLWDYTTGQLWYVPGGVDPATAIWTLVKSIGVPGGSSPRPMAVYDGWVYGTRSTSTSFEIYRSPHLGLATMTWTKVGAEGFGDATNNYSVAFMTEYDGQLVIGTNTLRGMFGDENAYAAADGVEVWATADRAGTTFSQINVDGFGTLLPGCVSSVCSFPTNQMIGCHAVYKAPGESEPSLYVGTKSHFGAEIWRWDGSSWTNVSQPWSCVGCLTSTPHYRNEAMVAARGLLFVAEGYPGADLATYDGSSWAIIEPGPAPFDAMNNGLLSLAAINNIVYVSTKRCAAASTGAQVWAGPLRRPLTLCSDLSSPSLPDLLYDPPEINWVLPEAMVELRWRLVNLGQRPSGSAFPMLIVRDGEVIFEELIPWLEPGEVFEGELMIEVGEGEHLLSMVADPEGMVEDAFADNNSLNLLIHAEQEH